MRIRDACAALALGALVLLPATEASASSHREAPFIAKMPKVDNTDFYMFRSYETGRADYVTLIANFQPLQDKYGGPNYFSMDSEALYEIHIDNTGDGKEDITFQFQFDNNLGGAGGTGVNLTIGPAGATQSVNIPFINANLGTGGAPPPITAANQGTVRHVNETYTVKVVRGNRRTGTAQDVTHPSGPGTAGATFIKPLDFIGTKSWGALLNNEGQAFADYNAYANAHIYPVAIPGCTPPAGTTPKIFVGQRHEHFAVLLGNIFDLVNAPAGALIDPNLDLPNTIGDKNVTTIAVEVPRACVKGTPDVIGGWSTASVRQARVINPTATYAKPSREGGAWAQVSRLGGPLVNEVVIGLKDKDKFNSSEPANDGTNFATYVTHPTLPAVLEALFGPTVQAPKLFPRVDLVRAFATGWPGVNAFPGATPTVAEMLRLNVQLPITAAGAQSRLGAAGCFDDDPAAGAKYRKVNTGLGTCDPAGFPNGRRPVDDVVDIALRVAMGALHNVDADAPFRNNTLGDAVIQKETGNPTFPYLDTPFPGAQVPN